MCTVLCVNTKCDKRQENGYCGRAYPCSECQPLIDRKITEDIMSSGDRTSLKDIARELHNQISDIEDERCIYCDHYKPCKCGKLANGNDNIVSVCDLDECPYED